MVKGAGDPSLALRDDTMSLWYRGKEVSIRKLLIIILQFATNRHFFPLYDPAKPCHPESRVLGTKDLQIYLQYFPKETFQACPDYFFTITKSSKSPFPHPGQQTDQKSSHPLTSCFQSSLY